MSSQTNGVLAKIKTVYKNAIFQLNLILERVAHQNKPVKIFFASIEGFSSYLLYKTIKFYFIFESGLSLEA
jgi:hypothetical protein